MRAPARIPRGGPKPSPSSRPQESVSVRSHDPSAESSRSPPHNGPLEHISELELVNASPVRNCSVLKNVKKYSIIEKWGCWALTLFPILEMPWVDGRSPLKTSGQSNNWQLFQFIRIRVSDLRHPSLILARSWGEVSGRWCASPPLESLSGVISELGIGRRFSVSDAEITRN